MSEQTEIEIVCTIRQDLRDILESPDDHAEAIEGFSPDLKAFIRRAGHPTFVDDTGSLRWTMTQFWVDVSQQLEQYGGSFGAFQADPNNAFKAWLEGVFAAEWQWLRPWGLFRYSDGMQIGTVADRNGDVLLDTPPWFPWNEAIIRRFLPPLLEYEEGDDPENPPPPTPHPILWDCTPYLKAPGQWQLSKGPPNRKRRVCQATDPDVILDANAFGVSPWNPGGGAAKDDRVAA